eukprot:1799621-Pyramimonas_sp.AAC.1
MLLIDADLERSPSIARRQQSKDLVSVVDKQIHGELRRLPVCAHCRRARGGGATLHRAVFLVLSGGEKFAALIIANSDVGAKHLRLQDEHVQSRELDSVRRQFRSLRAAGLQANRERAVRAAQRAQGRGAS